MVDHAREITRTEAVVDVDDRHAARAGIQHRKQSGKSVEGSAVAAASGDRRVIRIVFTSWRPIFPPCPSITTILLSFIPALSVPVIISGLRNIPCLTALFSLAGSGIKPHCGLQKAHTGRVFFRQKAS